MPKGRAKKTIGSCDQDPIPVKQPVISGLNAISLAKGEAERLPEVSQNKPEVVEEVYAVTNNSMFSLKTKIENTELVTSSLEEDPNIIAPRPVDIQTALPSPRDIIVSELAAQQTPNTETIEVSMMNTPNSIIHSQEITSDTRVLSTSNEQAHSLFLSSFENTEVEIDPSITNNEDSRAPEDEDWLDIGNPLNYPTQPTEPFAATGVSSFKQSEVITGKVSAAANYLYERAAPAISSAITITINQAVDVATNPKVQEVVASTLDLVCMSKVGAFVKIATSAFISKGQVPKVSSYNKLGDIKDQKLALINQILSFKFLKCEEREILLDQVNKNHDDQKMFKAIQVICEVPPEQKAIILNAIYCENSAEDQIPGVVALGQADDIEGG